jgi:hypothetical protein
VLTKERLPRAVSRTLSFLTNWLFKHQEHLPTLLAGERDRPPVFRPRRAVPRRLRVTVSSYTQEETQTGEEEATVSSYAQEETQTGEEAEEMIQGNTQEEEISLSPLFGDFYGDWI